MWANLRLHAEPRLTNVADMPGYPTKKLLFGGPDTRTNAAMVVAKSEEKLQTMRYGVRETKFRNGDGSSRLSAGECRPRRPRL